MKKFKVVVTRTEEYEIEVDEDIFDKNARKEFNDNFFEIKDLKGHAKNIAKQFSLHSTTFIEGYGEVDIDGENEDAWYQTGININCENIVFIETDAKEIE